MIELGTRAKDRISGFTGIITARTEWLSGCRRYTIEAQQMRDGKPLGSETFDEEQIEVLKGKPFAVRKFTGGPMPDIPRHNHVEPSRAWPRR